MSSNLHTVTQSQCIAWKCCRGTTVFLLMSLSYDVEMSDLAGRELEELAELSCDRNLKIQFREKSLSAF